MISITGLPAYGRDYKTADEARAAWLAGKDFVCSFSGRYFSVRDVEPSTIVMIYYCGQRKQTKVQ